MSDGHNLEAHLFICTNDKHGKSESCAARGSLELREAVKKLCQDESRGWHGRVRVNASGCLGRCKDGIAAVMYPQTQWFEHLKKDDVQVLESALKKVLDK